MTTKYKRVLLKMSGEAFAGSQRMGWDGDILHKIALDIKDAAQSGVQMCVVVGGGNLVRGAQWAAEGMDRTSADYMGMLATVINALALQGVLESMGAESRVVSVSPVTNICEEYVRHRCFNHLEKGRIVIFAGGTGNPYFTTDTAAALRASEMKCEALLKGTMVDGIYDADPKKDPTASRFEKLTYMEVLSKDLKVMDTAAVALARENHIPILVFSIYKEGELARILQGAGEYTLVA